MARGPQHVLGMAAVAVVGVATLGACGFMGQQTTEDTADVTDTVSAVRLDNAAGGVTLRGAKDADQVTVHREVRYHGDKPSGTSYRVDDGTLKLNGCGDDCAVRYTVDLPAGLPVEGKVSAGTVRLTDVGRVQVTTSSGNVELTGVTGPADVRTTAGRISGTRLTGGRIAARTGNGAIELTAGKPSDVRATTSSGPIELTVPRAGYRVSANTNNGHENIGVASDPSGTHRLDLSTSNGNIAVKSA